MRLFGWGSNSQIERVAMHDLEGMQTTFGGSQSLSGVRVNAETSLGYPAFWRGVNLIANVVAKLPLYVHREEEDGGSPLAKDHPAFGLLTRKANDYQTAAEFRKLLTIHAQVHGNGYAFIFRDDLGNPVKLIPLDPLATYPVKYIPPGKSAFDAEIWYLTSTESGFLTLSYDDVLHVKNTSLDGLVGLSVIDIMRESLGLGMAVREFGARFFGEGANAGGVLMVPGKINEKAQKNLLDYWHKMVGGMKKSHKIAVLQDGAKFEKTTIAPEDAQFLETKKFDLIEVANILGLPPHKLGDNSRSAYNSIEAENRNALDESYDPWLCTWEEECEAKLLTLEQSETESHLIEFDRQWMVQTTWTDRMNGYRVGREAGIFSVNDIRRMEGLELIGPEGDIRSQPANWGTLGKNQE